VSRKAEDLTGLRFGSVVVLRFAGTDGRNKRYWGVQCDCGNQFITRGDIIRAAVRARNAFSCSSCRPQNLATKPDAYRNTREFTAWSNMKTRCYNDNYFLWDRYGGRGIKVCDRWLNSFPAFLEDMGPLPSKEHSLDRIDNNADYTPENCRWATELEQANNKSTNLLIEFDGEVKTMAEWSRETGLDYGMLYARHQRGATGAELFKTKREVREKIYVTYDGATRSLYEWADVIGIDARSLYSRYDAGQRGAELLREPRKVALIEHNGITDTIPGWAKRTGLSRITLGKRFKNGDVGDALFRPSRKDKSKQRSST
jgi:hypothetical protein